jgi:hypothetical protein
MTTLPRPPRVTCDLRIYANGDDNFGEHKTFEKRLVTYADFVFHLQPVTMF